MIIHRLIRHHFKHHDDHDFYLIQAIDAIRWLESCGTVFERQTTVLDLGCGHGLFGAELMKKGCQITFADTVNLLLPELRGSPFLKVDLNRDDLGNVGQFAVVICSNVLEHLARAREFIASARHLLVPQGRLFLSWTNWLSPWGGHEFSPWHYLGPHWGPKLYDKLTGKKRIHTPYENLFPTYIESVLKAVKHQPGLRTLKLAPRYYTELAFLMHVPWVREFLAWNCALIIERTA